MKLKEFLTIIEKLKKEGKINDNTKIVYSQDDEWNSFEDVKFHPTLWKFIDWQFIDDWMIEDIKKNWKDKNVNEIYDEYIKESVKLYNNPKAERAICIN